ncbi:polyamine aminopropyltransferase [Streptomyces liangshanensis]|uniref:Polyamine aminopropyltransferase n=1 Tax=Streptomyces liangshanensis TaxID=2717324 RepID=A0A6G9H0C1_9ACTN|nr:polyamine aminopropyltransferase [Streptomyces liangshanensis]QIQ03577.1 polyamine aminopropyltransferase [Streptomyces liangshanensis]
MIEQSVSSPPQGGPPHGGPPPGGPPEGGARLPVRPDAGRFLILAVVFVCAACGLVYELELVALASYLIGDSVTQASVVLSVMVFAMGIGSLLAKRLRPWAAVGFGLVEAALALLGGCSALVLYASFAWVGESRFALVGFSLAIGVLIGAEIPLLMTLIQRVSRQDAGGTVADLFAADYVGALVGGLAFPFLLLPWLGQLTGALLTGAVNALAGGALVLWVFRRDLTPRSRLLLVFVNVLVLAVLAAAAVLVDDFERAARRAVYGDGVRVAVHTEVQEVVLTGGRGEPLDLYLDGRLRVSERDEYRYHEALVHPAMRGPHGRVLVLGGGDGLAAREVLRYGDVRSVTVVELDPGVVRLARTDPALSALNGHAYDDPRVRAVTADAFAWLRGVRGPDRSDGVRGDEDADDGTYDVIVSDLPNPGITASTKLYSEEFYGLARGALAPGGRLAVHAGSPTAQPRTYWTVDATLRAAGFGTTPYRAEGRLTRFTAGPDRVRGGPPATGDWGLVLAAPGRPPALGLAADAPRLRSLTLPELASDAREAADSRRADLPPSTLVHPRYGG